MKKIFFTLILIASVTNSFSQTSKNNWLIGGSASYSSTQEGDMTNTVLDISPRVGYFIANNFAVGVNVGINKTNDEGNNMSNVSFGPYVRYYFLPVGNNVKFFGNASLIIGNEDEGLDNSKLSGWGLAAGPAIFLNKSVALETSLAYTSTQAGIEQVKDNTLSFNIGVQIHFGK